MQVVLQDKTLETDTDRSDVSASHEDIARLLLLLCVGYFEDHFGNFSMREKRKIIKKKRKLRGSPVIGGMSRIDSSFL